MKLGDVTSQGCYKNDQRVGGARYCHNCRNQQGNQVRWTFEVLDDDDQVVGYVVAALNCNSAAGRGDEATQRQAIVAIARAQLPTLADLAE